MRVFSDLPRVVMEVYPAGTWLLSPIGIYWRFNVFFIEVQD